MTTPLSPEARRRGLRIIHGSLIAGVVLFLLVTAWVPRVMLSLGGQLGSVLRYIGLALFAGGAAMLRVLPRPDPGPGPGQGEDAWLAVTQSRLIVMWAVMEGSALFNAVVWFVTRDRVTLVPVALALLVLFALRPSRYLQ